MTNSSLPPSFTTWGMIWRRTTTRKSPPESYAHHSGPDRNARDKFLGPPWYQACKDFCANWDQCSFDPGYPSEPLSTFEPLLRQIFSRPAHDPRYVGKAS